MFKPRYIKVWKCVSKYIRLRMWAANYTLNNVINLQTSVAGKVAQKWQTYHGFKSNFIFFCFSSYLQFFVINFENFVGNHLFLKMTNTDSSGGFSCLFLLALVPQKLHQASRNRTESTYASILKKTEKRKKVPSLWIHDKSGISGPILYFFFLNKTPKSRDYGRKRIFKIW